MQHVYLLQEIEAGGTAPTGFYKIGKTKATVEDRKKNYRAGNPRRLDTLHTIQVTDAQAIETTLHRRLTYYRRKYGGGDEWFDFRDVNINSVIEIMNEYAEVPAYAVWGSSYSDVYDDSYGDSYEDEDSYEPSFKAFNHSYSGYDYGTDSILNLPWCTFLNHQVTTQLICVQLLNLESSLS